MLGMILVAAASSAAPVYLECELHQEDGKLPVYITANEGTQRATVSLQTGRVVERLAVFTPEKLAINDEQMIWTIDRVSLVIQREFDFAPGSFETGTCKIVPSPADRAF